MKGVFVNQLDFPIATYAGLVRIDWGLDQSPSTQVLKSGFNCYLLLYVIPFNGFVTCKMLTVTSEYFIWL
ncbi:hypothetical protein H6P81_018737 [Aristolochia fimbriata]|uniref:Uncharacterized protein n=1 Tax=Aristolochia fimbriata TaxID=158543 RepID=A0AAV7E258_ARIFI|nr:hypothetical protein H6P81_018737 [Aristolochia fimbriata]